jgi:hypothetical protein
MPFGFNSNMKPGRLSKQKSNCILLIDLSSIEDILALQLDLAAKRHSAMPI